MFPIETFISFATASILLAAAPGPDNIFVLTQSALQGPRAGLVVTLGLCSGLVVHTTAVALGVAAIFQTSTAAYTALKLAGAGYLLYLAWQAFHASATKISTDKGIRMPLSKLYKRGIIMNVTNPKVSIFFLAFLPLFADPARGPIAFQIMGLGVIFIFSTILVFSAVALISGSVGQWLNRSERAQRLMNLLAGMVFVTLAAALFIEKG
ncbi:MAG: LysE family translocator [Desulfosalsimonadaceae bacterium]